MSCGCNKSPCECQPGFQPGYQVYHPANPRLNLTPGGFPGGPPCCCGYYPCTCSGVAVVAGAGPAPAPPGCTCSKSPCECERCTLCDLYVLGTPNVWVLRGDASPNLFLAATPDYSRVGNCSLDTLSEAQVINIIERDQKARADLLKVTSNKRLRHLALSVPKLPTQELVDAEQLNQNRPNEPAAIPFYTVFRGQPPFAQ